LNLKAVLFAVKIAALHTPRSPGPLNVKIWDVFRGPERTPLILHRRPMKVT